MSTEARETERERQLLARIFHLISQPMTALQCSLELALNAEEDSRERRGWVEAALEHTERLRSRLSLARQLADASDVTDAPHGDCIALKSVLQEAIGELQPLFEMEGSVPQLLCDEIEVAGDGGRLRRVFLSLLEQLSGSNGPTSYVPTISVEHEAEWVVVRFLRFVLRANCNEDSGKSQLEIARKTVESIGGRLIFFCFARNDAFVRVFLQPAHLQMELYGDAMKKKSAPSDIGTRPALPQVS